MHLNQAAKQRKNKLVPLINQQRRFWYDYQHSPLAAGKNILLFALKFSHGTDRAQLDQAITNVFNRHQLLRATLVGHEKSWPQFCVYPEISVVLKWHESLEVVLPITPANAPADVCRGFDLTRELPWRVQGISTPHADYVIFAFHHIICDELSIRVLVREIDEAMASLSSTAIDDDFVNAARLIADEQQLQLVEGGLSFWNEALTGSACALNMPFENDGSSTTASVYRSKTQISGNLLKQLHQFSADEQLTFPIILAAAYAVVLSLYSHDQEVILGIPVSLRPPEEAQNAIGPFLNILPLRCKLSEGITFSELCQSMRQDFLSALDYSAIPFEDIVRIASKEKLAGRHPLFQTTYSFHDMRESEFMGLKHCHQVETWSGSLSCELSLICELNHNELDIFIDGDNRCFKDSFIDRLVQHVEWVAIQLTRFPDERIDACELLPQQQQQKLLTELSGIHQRQATPPVLPLLLDSFSSQQENFALSGQVKHTYAELLQKSTRVAESLRRAGVKKGEYVLVGIEDDGNPVTEILGIILSGAAWIPLNCNWPRHQIELVASKSEARFRLGSPLSLENVAYLECVDTEIVKIHTPDLSITSPIYAISTSGTTGEPKVAAIPWLGIANRFAWMNAMYGEGKPVTLKTTPWIYDSSVWQFLWPLTLGGRCVIPSRNEIFDPVALTELIEKEGITVIDFVPSVLNALLPALESTPSLCRKMQTLRWIIIGAESLPTATAKKIKMLLPAAKIINSYGPTEASIGCVYQPVELPLDRNVPIGNPIPNVFVAVVDQYQHLVPQGAHGELLLMGDCVGLGYLGTKEQKGFIEVNISPELNGPAYKTGDLVRWNEQGQLEFIARLDRQVKLRGVRLELAAIETAIDAFPGVTGSHTLIVTQDSGKDTLVSFIKTMLPDTFDSLALAHALRSTLPGSSIPEHFIVVDMFPLAPSGKIDSKTLIATFLKHQRNKLAAPADETVKPVEQIWRRILGVNESLDPEINFFDAGGHSLILLDLQRALNQKFGASLSLVDLFNYPTISDQERLLTLVPNTKSRQEHL